MDDYYAYRQIPIFVRGEPAVMVGKPGVWSWDDVNAGTAALIEIVEVDAAAKVLDLGCGTGLMGLAAARMAPEGHVTLVDVNVAAVGCAQRTMEVNKVLNAEVQLADGTDAVNVYDLILCHLPRGRVVVEDLIQQAAMALKPGGQFYLVAHKRSGVKGAIAYGTKLLGQGNVVRHKQGYHVALLRKEQSQPSRISTSFHQFEIMLDGHATTLISRPGVFAWDRPDDGTLALTSVLEIESGETVLDLGCGTGLLSVAAARRGALVTAIDADLRAVESARRTLAANGVAGQVLVSDCAQAVLERRFDVVLCNPPFHQGIGVEYEVAHQMVRDAARVLRPGGRFYLVSNAFLRYEREMQHFASVSEIFNDQRYRVLRASPA
jgi:16S rRNA (guanine1207-N2)-methyltransferase